MCLRNPEVSIGSAEPRGTQSTVRLGAVSGKNTVLPENLWRWPDVGYRSIRNDFRANVSDERRDKRAIRGQRGARRAQRDADRNETAVKAPRGEGKRVKVSTKEPCEKLRFKIAEPSARGTDRRSPINQTRRGEPTRSFVRFVFETAVAAAREKREIEEELKRRIPSVRKQTIYVPSTDFRVD